MMTYLELSLMWQVTNPADGKYDKIHVIKQTVFCRGRVMATCVRSDLYGH